MGYSVTLPLGLDSLLGSMGSSDETLRCGVKDCPCTCFRQLRVRCKYGEQCCQRKPEHLDNFCHPCDTQEWEINSTVRDRDMCRCKHKKKLHSSRMSMAGAVQYPPYWENAAKGDQDFNQLV